MKSKFTTDDRGVSEVIGAILIFGLAIMLLAILQTQAVPAANQEVEFNHNDQIQSQLVDFHQAAAETARKGDADSTKLDMGAQYPNRMLFFNPPTPSGSLQTGEEQTVTIENANAEDPTVAKYVDSGPLEVSTRSLSYQPNYNEYRAAPVTRYEYGVLYNDHTDTQLLVNDGGVIQGREISLLMPAGELHESSSRAISIDPRPISAPANTVSITGDGSGDPVTLTLPSSMERSLWQDAIDSNHVQDVIENGDGTVTIELDPSQTYTLRMARIGVGSNTPSQDSTYLYSSSGTQLDIPQGQSRVIDVEVRDEYNNPVPHEDVKFEVDQGAIQNDVSTGADGVAKPRFDAPSDPTRTTIRATLDEDFSNFNPSSDPRDLELDVWVTQFAGGYGSDPSISVNSYEIDCGNDGNLIDDPVDTISSDDTVVSIDWEVSHTDTETNIDTVDIRLVRSSNSQIGDSAHYAYDEVVDDGSTQTVGDETGLVDRDACPDSYDIQIFAETTGGATDIETIEDISP